MYKFRSKDLIVGEFIFSDGDDVFIKHEKKNNILALYKKDKKFGGYDRVGQAYQFIGIHTNSTNEEIYDKDTVIFTAGEYTDKIGHIEHESGMWVVVISDTDVIPVIDILENGTIDLHK